MMAGSAGVHRFAVVICGALALLLSGCTVTTAGPVTLRVAASSELADLGPVLDELRADTGIDLQLDTSAPPDAALALRPGGYRHDLAWLSTESYFQLELAERPDPVRPLSTRIMRSPVVVGVTPELARSLRASGRPVSWATIADRAARGGLRFAMGDPERTDTGLAALVGVATAAAGTGRALRPEDVTCDSLRGFLAGQKAAGATTNDLLDRFVANQDGLDAVVTTEAAVLSLNDSRRLRQPLEIVYPADGVVQFDYPLILLDPAKRAAYDRVVDWLGGQPAQQRIAESTARRPIAPDVPRPPRLSVPTGNSLYFPSSVDVIDTLVTNYRAATSRPPGHVIFMLDFSGSMRGPRIAAVRAAFANLTGAGTPSFGAFRVGERLTVAKFGGRVLDVGEFAVDRPADLEAVRRFVGVDTFDERTAVYTALAWANERATVLTAGDPSRPVSVVLMTDGLSNAGPGVEQYLAGAVPGPRAPTIIVRAGEADPAELARVAAAGRGRLFDAGDADFPTAFEDLRGCQ